MTILHVCDTAGPDEVNGVSTVVWALAGAQAAAGHAVHILSREPLNPAGRAHAGALGIGHWTPPRRSPLWLPGPLAELLARLRPEAVHMHSVFIPQQAQLALALRARRIPYVTTPHGQLSAQSLGRGRLKKWPYATFVERPRLRGAAAITALTPGEADDVRAFVPGFGGQVEVLPNPFPPLESGLRWAGRGAKTLVYLGRFDVLQKGIDHLVALAGALPEYSLVLYGSEDAKTLDWLNRLRQSAPPNVRFAAPVFGEAKLRVLCEAGAYVQLSRWEGFAMSVLEAMSLGTPCLLSDGLQMTQTLREAGLALTLGGSPQEMAAQARRHLGDPAALEAWSQRARHFTQTELSPQRVAERYVALYRRVTGIQG